MSDLERGRFACEVINRGLPCYEALSLSPVWYVAVMSDGVLAFDDFNTDSSGTVPS